MKRFGRIVFSGLLLTGLFSFGLNENAKEAKATIDINDYTACQTAHNSGNASNLLAALRTITSPGSAGSYNDLWNTYKTAYVKANGKMMDYYSS